MSIVYAVENTIKAAKDKFAKLKESSAKFFGKTYSCMKAPT